MPEKFQISVQHALEDCTFIFKTKDGRVGYGPGVWDAMLNALEKSACQLQLGYNTWDEEYGISEITTETGQHIGWAFRNR